MTIEQSLAARKIATMIAEGFSVKCAIEQAAKLVKSQGFSTKHAKQVATQMAQMVA